MKVMSIEEMNASSGAVTLDQRVRAMKVNLPEWGNGFAIPEDSGKKTALARFLATLVMSQPDSEAVVYISEWGVWPSSQHLELFDSYRLAKGETRSLGEAPVHRFSASDAESLVSLLCLVLYFVWDAEVFDAAGKCLFSISHDEWLDIRTGDQAAIESCVSAVEHHMLKALATA